MQYIYDEQGILTSTVFPELPGVGVLTPSNGVELIEELVQKEGYVWLYQNGRPIQVKDNRGTYYSKETSETVEFTDYGDIPDTLTKKAPGSSYDKWDGRKWVKDGVLEAAEVTKQALTQRDALNSTATQKIAPLQDAVDLDMASNEELEQLKEWKKYRVLLNRVEQQEGFPDKIEWPDQPLINSPSHKAVDWKKVLKEVQF